MNPTADKGVFALSFDSLRQYLTAPQKRKGVLVVLMLLVSSFVDIASLAALVQVIMVASEKGAIQKSRVFSWLYTQSEFTTERNFLMCIIAVLFLFFVFKNIFSVWITKLQTKFSASVGMNLIGLQLNKYLNLPFWYFSDVGSSNFGNGSMMIPNSYVTGVLRPLFVLFSEIAVIGVMVVGIVVYKPLLLLILALVLVPTTLLTYRAMRARSLAIGNRLNELRPVGFKYLQDIYNGYTELKLAGKLQQFRARIVDVQSELQDLEGESYLFAQLPLKVIELVAILGVVTILVYALYFANGSAEVIGLVGLFAAAAYRLMPSVNRLLVALMQLKQHQYTIYSLATFTEAHHRQEIPEGQLALSFNDSISFERVSFTFPNEPQPAIRGISLRIAKGEKIGFIGSSGSGKTTLMNILLRFYVEQEGAIKIDGQRLTSQYLKAWYELVGYVKQDTFLMEASIKDNITLNASNVDMGRLAYAIEQASLGSFIDGLPQGYNTPIGERGSKLSGGQRQRIGIARALYKRTKVLILDEATSALDNETEREVNEAINKISATDITVLIIAHRITTLRECTRIYELGHGEIIGEHEYDSVFKRI